MRSLPTEPFRDDMAAGVRPVERCLGGLALGAGLAALLLWLASWLSVGWGGAFDPAILLRVRAAVGEHGAAAALAKGITAFGNDVTLWAVTLLAAGYLIAARRRGAALHLLGAAGVGGLLTAGIKHLVERPRPALVAHLVEVHPPSFPSGHAADSAFVYGTLALIAVGGSATPAVRRYLAAAMLLVVVMVGASRVVLGVHWPSDVLAGWALGAGWALTAGRIARSVVARRP